MNSSRLRKFAGGRIVEARSGVLTALFVWFIAGGAFAAANGSKANLTFQSTWVDPYESTQYSGALAPGMVLIAAPGSQVSLNLEIEDKTDTRAVQVLSLSHASEFAQNGGRILARPKAAEVRLLLPDTGGTYSISFGYRMGYPSGPDSAGLTILIPKKVKLARGRINGYVIGRYPEPRADQVLPDRFVEITPNLMDQHLSRHFRVRDFVSNSRTADQQAFFPKYAIIRYALIIKVEKVVEAIDRYKNFECKGVRVLSGYRTPDYNRVLQEAAENSYHQYGLAADIIVDSAPADGRFDDINQDGKLDHRDVLTLAKFCEHLEGMGHIPHGGIGIYEYRHTTNRGKWYATYHVHVDVRKSDTRVSRWGYAFRDGRKFATISWN